MADDAWEFCESLSSLDLGGNRLQLLDRFTLRRLPRLRHLSLRDNRISHLEDEQDEGSGVFAETPLLETLDLSGNELSHTVEDSRAPFRGLAELRELRLGRNRIGSVGADALVGLESLEELELEGNVVSTFQKGAFEHTPLLR